MPGFKRKTDTVRSARTRLSVRDVSVSTPCLAEGIWIEDVAGRRYMDFHGNNVHHVGYAHPHVIASMDELSFAPRRFANEVAVQLAGALGTHFKALTARP